MKGVGRTVLLLVVACVLALGLAEILLRIVHVPAIEIHRRGPVRGGSTAFFEYDAALGWRGRPGARGTLSGWEFTSDVRLNSRGFRDAEVAVAKPPDIFRIVVLGDSITWGYGVDAGQRYPDLLDAPVTRAGVPVEIVNLAVSGYATDQELLLWERQARRYCADLVILGLYENDLRENLSPAQGNHAKPYFVVGADGSLTLRNVPVPVMPAAPSPPEPSGVRAWLRRHLRLWAALGFVRESFRGRGGPEIVPAGAVDVTAALVRRLGDAIAASGSRFLVVVLPNLYDSPDTMAAATRSGVETILDLGPHFRREASADTLFFRLDGAHWTVKAHALAARAIADVVTRGRLLSPPPRVCPGAP